MTAYAEIRDVADPTGMVVRGGFAGVAVCLDDRCVARRACPVNQDGYDGEDRIRFHMRAFTGDA